MILTVTNISTISKACTDTGYASITKAPGVLPNFNNPKYCCSRQSVSPRVTPTTAPTNVISQPSKRNIRVINVLFAPRLFNILTSSSFSIISIVSEPITLNTAIIRMMHKMRNVTHFSTFTIR